MVRTLTMAVVAGLASAILVPLAIVLWILAAVPGTRADSIGIGADVPLQAGLAGAAAVLIARLIRSRRALRRQSDRRNGDAVQ